MLMPPSRQRLATYNYERLQGVNEFQDQWQQYLSYSTTSASDEDLQLQEYYQDLVTRARKIQRPQVHFALLCDLTPFDGLTLAMVLRFLAYSHWYVVKTVHLWRPPAYVSLQDLDHSLML